MQVGCIPRVKHESNGLIEGDEKYPLFGEAVHTPAGAIAIWMFFTSLWIGMRGSPVSTRLHILRLPRPVGMGVGRLFTPGSTASMRSLEGYVWLARSRY